MTTDHNHWYHKKSEVNAKMFRRQGGEEGRDLDKPEQTS